MKLRKIFFVLLSFVFALSFALTQEIYAEKKGGKVREKVKEQIGAKSSDAQKENIKKLASDLKAIKEKSQVTPEQKAALKQSLMNLAQGATKPDQALVQKLADDLAKAVADGNISPQDKAKLASDLEKVLNSANIPKEEVEKAITDAKAIVTASGITKEDAEVISSDLKAIATEAQKNVPTQTQ